MQYPNHNNCNCLPFDNLKKMKVPLVAFLGNNRKDSEEDCKELRELERIEFVEAKFHLP